MAQMSTQQMINFAFLHPLFAVSLILSCIFFVIMLALSFGGLSDVWEKRFGKMLIVTIIPVSMWIIFFFRPFFNPVHAAIIAWLGMFLFVGYRKLSNKVNEIKYLKESDSWRCPKCKSFNEKVYIFCKECNEPQVK